MNKFFLLSLAVFLLLPLASGLEVTPLKKQAVLSPCQQTVFPFEINGNGPVSLSLANAPAWLNSSVVQSFNVNNRGVVDVAVLYPCDASPRTGTYALTLVARQGNEAKAATVYLSASPASSLLVSLSSQELACACGSANFDLVIRNTGRVAESGTLLVSSQFEHSVSDTGFSLLPGQSVSKQIVVDLPCETPAGVYPLSVGIVSQGGNVKYAHSAISTAQCLASNFTGPTQVTACYGDVVNIPYTIYNSGMQGQSYSISTTLGSTSITSTEIPGHSTLSFNVSIPASQVTLPGNSSFAVQVVSDNSISSIPVSLTSKLCPGKPVPIIAVSYPELEPNNTIVVSSGVNRFSIGVRNPNNFSITRAVLSLEGFGPVSDFFDLGANETKQVQLVVDVPSNFTGGIMPLILESDQGKGSKAVSLHRQGPITGYFLLGAFVSSENLVAIAVALVILASLFYYAETQRRKQVLIDMHIGRDLSKILAKYAARR